ncbi:MAG: DUF4184 family protein [Candidatus Korobacteraceae bacterium]
MPFTLAHPAAALPFRKTRLVISAVVVGSMAPDFEYFLRLAPQGRYFHTPSGLFLCTLPVGMAVLWLFHRCARYAVVRLLPTCVQQRLVCRDFPFGNLRRFGLLALSVMVGALTHVLWDSFTHRRSWIVRHWPLLHQQVLISWPIHRSTFVCIVLQHLSGLIGMAMIAIWCLVWLRTTPPAHAVEAPLSRGTKFGILLLLFGLSLGGALLRTALFRPASPIADLGVFVVTWIALLWWALVALGWWWRPQRAAGPLHSIPCAAAAAPASPADTRRKPPAAALPGQ